MLNIEATAFGTFDVDFFFDEPELGHQRQFFEHVTVLLKSLKRFVFQSLMKFFLRPKKNGRDERLDVRPVRSL